METGYIKLWRSFEKWEWFSCDNMAKFFIWLLLRATHKDVRFRGVEIKRGQMIFGRSEAVKATGISAQSIRSCIKRLKSTSEITIKSTNKFSVITIVNYSTYQGTNEETNQQINQPSNQQVTNNQPATNQQLTSKKSSFCIADVGKEFDSKRDSLVYENQKINHIQEVKKTRNKYKRDCTDKEFLEFLNDLCLSRGCDLEAEMIKMDRWLADHPDRRKTRRFMEGWINRADRVVTVPGLQITKRATKLQGIPSNPNRIGLAEICPTNSQSSLINQ